MPSLPGTTARIPPLTPLLAGTPTSYAHCPAASYMPHVYMTLRRSRTSARGSARSAVNGLTAPLASVAPITASCAQVTRTEHCRRYSASSASTSPSNIPSARMRYAVARLRSAWRNSRANVRSSTSRRSPPAHASMTAISRSILRSPLAPCTRSVVTRAPALTIGLYGRWCRSSNTIELNASPLGSTPTRASTSARRVVPHARPAVARQRERVGEHLRDRLERERLVVVALAVQLAVHRCQADREAVT